ncbi:GGDEF domain-containing protein [Roseibium algae]|uniref:diguanylate cyclase n=1 Tax=Roseibium algae TaxID=3123038 RepID=A0ABU8TKQ4_9HYPH
MASVFYFQNTEFPFVIANLILACLSLATAIDYWPQNSENLSSKYGLSFCYAFIGISFLLHSAQGVELTGIATQNQLMLSIHQTAALIFVTSSGAFSLALAFEQTVAEHKEAAHRDPLTGTFNRREFSLRIKELLGDANHASFAVVQFDLDHFKAVNDSYGHGAGDEALQMCSDVMQWHLREQDCLARTGGEEFAALLPSIGKAEAFAITERIRKTIANMPLHFAPDEVRLTLSAGIYHGRGDGLDDRTLLKLADNGLYESKRAGRNKVSLVTSMRGEEPTHSGPLLEART